MITYDYIILGGGASGLMMAYRMVSDSFFDNKSIIIIDQEKKESNDRTWCFWEEHVGEWDDITEISWKQIMFKSKYIDKLEKISPYQYKMVRSSEFYKKIWDAIDKKSNISFLKSNVKSLEQKEGFAQVKTDNKVLKSNRVLNSILFDDYYKFQTKYPFLQQHFLGYFIKTKEETFDVSSATFMDFSIQQKGNTRFMYVLPYSKTEALFEYTLFSEHLLNKEEYKNEIDIYLKEKGITDYAIIEIEQGSIPMTCFPFWKNNSKNIMHMGTAGGWTKASTGFTFKSIDRKSKKLISYLKLEQPLNKFQKRNRFWFYDLLLLDILKSKNHLGAQIFSRMFETIKPETILKFLDENTHFTQEISIFSKMQKRLFIKAVLKRIFSF